MKRLKVNLVLASALLLGACNTDEEVISEKEESDVEDSILNETQDTAAQAEKAIDDAMKTFSIATNYIMEQSDKTVTETAGESYEVVNDFSVSSFLDPEAFHATLNGTEVKSEAYLTDQGYFIKDEMNNEWISLPVEMHASVFDPTDAQDLAIETMTTLKGFVGDMEVKEIDGNYELTLSATPETADKFEELGMQSMGASYAEFFTDSPYTFEKMDYHLLISKETNEILAFSESIAMVVTEELGTTKITKETTTSYQDYNSVEPIVAPEEVVKNAQSLQ